MNRRLYKYAVDLFVEMLNQVQKRTKPYRCNDNDTNAWNIWVDYNKKNKIPVTEEYIRKFIEYGLQSWFNDDISFTQRMNVRFSWVFASKAIERWNALSAKSRQRFVQTDLKKKNDLRVKKGASTRLTELLKKVRPIEEGFKNEYLNTPRGLLWCKANTTLYNHRSSACTICDNKEECKELLRLNMPNVYRLRGYGKR